MAAVCALCGKAPSFGNRVSRSGKAALKRRVFSRTRRRFRPNLQRRKVIVDGTPKHILVCTACLKKMPRA
ncbi:50S ribosomal protein L28 [Tenggerimyces flavus]|uniref:Large ribosomal subunit protein bL28 n=2 Tax=Tenggerimyces flavus TaxID=1708749 RepID=A0ABV7YIY4_9ACTN|nr:50S ribosomal protein L28 [Tenggerimyces flavus]MBM7787642.1 large subunit ribosomal protein L28 [Tenggerimyces flavus]